MKIEAKLIGYCAFGIESNVALLDYAGSTPNEVLSKVASYAWQTERYRGTGVARMAELGWEVRAIFASVN